MICVKVVKALLRELGQGRVTLNGAFGAVNPPGRCDICRLGARPRASSGMSKPHRRKVWACRGRKNRQPWLACREGG